MCDGLNHLKWQGFPNNDLFDSLFLCLLLLPVHTTMKAALSTLTSERERLKQCLDHETCPPTSPQVVNLKNTLAAVCEITHPLAHFLQADVFNRNRY